MSLTQFITLIKRHLVYLTGIPVGLATLVLFLTQGAEKKYRSETKIYTGIASGYTIESGANSRIDYFSVNNAFDNLLEVINGRETKEEVGIRLLSQHILLDSTNDHVISQPHLEELRNLITPTFFDSVKRDTYDETVLHIYSLLKSRDQNPVKFLLNSPLHIYSPEGLGKIKFTRIASSDMIKGEFEYRDAGVCQQALIIYSEVFSNRFKDIKQSETKSVVQYFEEQSQNVYKRLTNEENSLREFREDNKIINYYEQTKYISSKYEDLEEAIHTEKMTIAAAEAASVRTEEYLGNRKTVLKHSDDILELRNQLTQASRELAFEQTNTKPDPKRIATLERVIANLKEDLTKSIQELYDSQHSTEGLPLKELLNEWLENTLIVDQGKAKIDVLQERKKEFEVKYAQFAPLGSSLKRYDRKIDVIEREYLQLLNSLNLSKMRQQNLELSNTLKVIDSPHFPLLPEPSKRGMLIIMAGLVGGILTLTVIIALEFLDSTMKSISIGQEKTSLKLVSAFPNLHYIDPDVHFGIVSHRLIQELLQQIKIRTPEYHNPILISIFSTREREGKTHIAELIKNNLVKKGKKVLFLSPSDDSQQSTNYRISSDFSEKQSVNDLLPEGITSREYDFILFEIPALSTENIPSELVKHTDFNLMIARSNRTWNSSDEHALETYKKMAKHEPYLFLNGLRTYELEPLIGEIPKARSQFRTRIKRLLRFNLNSKSKF